MGSLGRNLRIKYMHSISYRGILVIAKYYYNIRINTFVCRRRILSRKRDVTGNMSYFRANSNPQQQHFPGKFSPRIFSICIFLFIVAVVSLYQQCMRVLIENVDCK